ncbi:beta strand repeat-containing protein, partial [Flavobacterium gilvum]|uniref:beta strand repeat-containing protein n=1 Tax=Flavobacterium gilvum TaxID=1492737 RepID=UPI00055108D5
MNIKFVMTKNIALITLFLILSLTKVTGQTRGLIFDPIPGGGKNILDPNGDGYVSFSPSGFVSNDETESEIPYASLVFPADEGSSDLGSGPNCGFTDFVQQTVGVQDAAQNYLVPVTNEWLFRMRLGKTSSNSKSYSILIDTDGKFGQTGPNADPDWCVGNPGFEIEIVLATNFGVYVYNVNNNMATANLLKEYLGHTNYQKSIALTNECGDPDYFYDFFVDFDDITPLFPSLTKTSPIRMVLVDNMSANASSIVKTSSRSDLGGSSCTKDMDSCMGDIIDNYTPCAPGQVCQDRTSCPAINGPIVNGATSVSVTTNEAIGTIIKVYNGSTLIGTSAATTTSPQTLSITVTAVSTGNSIGATAQAPGKGVSIDNCSSRTVANCSGQTSSSSVTITSISGGKGFDIANNFPLGTIITWYNSDLTLANIVSGNGGNIPNPVTTTASNQTVSFQCKTGQCFPSGTYYFTFKEPGKCTSDYLLSCLYATGTSSIPSFTTSTIATTTSSVSGTGVNGAIVYLYADGIQVGSASVSSGVWTVPVSGLLACQSITVKQIESGKCISASPTAIKVSDGVSSKPSILQDACMSTSLTSIKVTASESSTATVKLYSFTSSSTYDPIAGTSSYAPGVWIFTPTSSFSAGTIVATVTDATKCKTESTYSDPIVLTTAPSINTSTTVTGPVYENSTTVSGTGVNGEWIQLYVDGSIPYKNVAGTLTPIGRVQVSGNVWSVTVDKNSIYLDAVLKVTTSTASTGGCESPLSTSSVTVQCTPPTLQTYAGGSHSYCNGQAGFVTLDSSESGVIYQLVNGAGTAVGPSAVGTGGIINLFTNALTTNLTNVFVKAYKLLNTTCSITSTVPINFDNQSPSPGITLTNSNVSVLKGDTTAAFAYTSPVNSPTNYSIAFSIAAKSQGFSDVSSATLSSSPINVLVPAGAAVGTYNAVLVITGGGACSSTYPISIIVYTSGSAPIIDMHPLDKTICPTVATSFSVSATSSTAVSYQWQVSIDNGFSWSNLSNVAPYSNATNQILSISNAVSTAYNGYKYRCIATNTYGSTASNQATLTVLSNPNITSQPSDLSVCTGNGASFSISQSGGTSIKWQVDNVDITDGGVYSGATTGTLSISNVTGLNGKKYNAVVSNNCSNVNSNQALLSVNTLPTASITGTTTVCKNGTAPNITFTGAGGTAPYIFTYNINGGSNFTVTTTSGNSILVSAPTSAVGTFVYNLVSVKDASSTTCSQNQSGTATISVTTPANAGTIAGVQNICALGTTAFTSDGDTGGTWTSSDTAIATVNASTGAVLGIASGTATITYMVTGTGGCANATASRTVTVTALPAVPTIVSVAPTCVSDGTSAISNYSASTTYTFTPATAGITINTSTGLISGMTVGTSYTVKSTSGGCTSSFSAPFGNAAMLATPAVPTIASVAPTCVSDGTSTISNYSASTTYAFTPATTGITINASTGLISGMTVGTSYTVKSTSGGCTSSASAAFSNTTILPTPAQPTVLTVAATCLSAGSMSITNYNSANVYTFSPSGPTVDATGVITGGTVGSTYSVTAKNGSNCSSVASMDFTIINTTILPTPAQPTVLTVAATCLSAGSMSITNYNSANVYTFSPSGPTVDATGVITGGTVGSTYSVTAKNGSNCSSVASMDFTIIKTPYLPTTPPS